MNPWREEEAEEIGWDDVRGGVLKAAEREAEKRKLEEEEVEEEDERADNKRSKLEAVEEWVCEIHESMEGGGGRGDRMGRCSRRCSEGGGEGS
jgi:hypothetical protein